MPQNNAQVNSGRKSVRKQLKSFILPETQVLSDDFYSNNFITITGIYIIYFGAALLCAWRSLTAGPPWLAFAAALLVLVAASLFAPMTLTGAAEISHDLRTTERKESAA